MGAGGVGDELGPAVCLEAVERQAGVLTGDPGAEGEVADGGVDVGGDGVEGDQVEGVEDAAVCGAVGAAPAGGGGVGALLPALHVEGEVFGAGEEGVVGAVAVAGGGHDCDGAAPLPGQGGDRGVGAGGGAGGAVAGVGVAQGADVFQAGGVQDGDHVVEPAAGAGHGQQDREQVGGGVDGVLPDRGRHRGRQGTEGAGQVGVAVGVAREPCHHVVVEASQRGECGDVFGDQVREPVEVLGGGGGAGQDLRVTGHDPGGAAGGVGGAWGADAAGDQVPQRGPVQGGAGDLHPIRDRMHHRSRHPVVQGHPDVPPMADAARGAHQVLDAHLIQPAGDPVPVRGRLPRGGLGLAVQVERDQMEQAVGVGQVHRPRGLRRLPVDRRAADVLG